MSNKVGKALKEVRGNKTQQQLAFELGVVRETVSKYENGRTSIPQDISKKLVEKYDDPKFVMTIRNAYTGTGPIWLDGENVDLHRSSVKEKTIEELKEALDAILKTCLAKPPKMIKHFERQEVENMLVEAVDAITALDHFVAVVCTEAQIGYREIWQKHYRKLASAGYISGLGG